MLCWPELDSTRNGKWKCAIATVDIVERTSLYLSFPLTGGHRNVFSFFSLFFLSGKIRYPLRFISEDVSLEGFLETDARG